MSEGDTLWEQQHQGRKDFLVLWLKWFTVTLNKGMMRFLSKTYSFLVLHYKPIYFLLKNTQLGIKAIIVALVIMLSFTPWKTIKYSNSWIVWKGLKRWTVKDELPRLVGAQYATGDQWRSNSRKNEEMEPKQKQHSAVDVTDDEIKVRCCKEQYCIET